MAAQLEAIAHGLEQISDMRAELAELRIVVEGSLPRTLRRTPHFSDGLGEEPGTYRELSSRVESRLSPLIQPGAGSITRNDSRTQS